MVLRRTGSQRRNRQKKVKSLYIQIREGSQPLVRASLSEKAGRRWSAFCAAMPPDTIQEKRTVPPEASEPQTQRMQGKGQVPQTQRGAERAQARRQQSTQCLANRHMFVVQHASPWQPVWEGGKGPSSCHQPAYSKVSRQGKAEGARACAREVGLGAGVCLRVCMAHQSVVGMGRHVGSSVAPFKNRRQRQEAQAARRREAPPGRLLPAQVNHARNVLNVREAGGR